MSSGKDILRGYECTTASVPDIAASQSLGKPGIGVDWSQGTSNNSWRVGQLSCFIWGCLNGTGSTDVTDLQEDANECAGVLVEVVYIRHGWAVNYESMRVEDRFENKAEKE